MQLILLVGIQAAGKSTFYKHYFADTHLRLNLDMLKTRHREHLLFEAALASKTKVVIDNTNPTPADRQRYIEPAKAAGYQIDVYYFEPDLKSSLARNELRQGKARIPDLGVRATYRKLVAPQLHEGIDALFRVRIMPEQTFSIQPL